MMKSTSRILIVEDDNLLAKRIEKDLTNEGFEITQIVGSMSDAVASAKKTAPDLALIDIKLDGPEDGIETGKELQKIVDIPIIYITGEPTYLDLAKRSEPTHPAAFLEKPIRTSELIVQVNLAMNNFYYGLLPLSKRAISDHVVLLVEREYVNVRQSHILFLEADGPYTKVFVTPEEHERLYQNRPSGFLFASPNLGRISAGLQPYFYKVSRGHIINLMHISRLRSEEVILGSHRIPFPEGRSSELLNSLNAIRKTKH